MKYPIFLMKGYERLWKVFRTFWAKNDVSSVSSQEFGNTRTHHDPSVLPTCLYSCHRPNEAQVHTTTRSCAVVRSRKEDRPVERTKATEATLSISEMISPKIHHDPSLSFFINMLKNCLIFLSYP